MEEELKVHLINYTLNHWGLGVGPYAAISGTFLQLTKTNCAQVLGGIKGSIMDFLKLKFEMENI